MNVPKELWVPIFDGCPGAAFESEDGAISELRDGEGCAEESMVAHYVLAPQSKRRKPARARKTKR